MIGRFMNRRQDVILPHKNCVIAIALFLMMMTHAETLPIETLKPSLDVGIIVSDIDKAKAFYGDVLGLKQTAILPMPDGSTMYRYQTGTSTVKLRAVPKASKYSGAVREAVGVRLLTFYLDDFDGILKRWAAGGGEQPKVMDAGSNGAKFTFITDPDGNQIELVNVDSGRIAIGLTVSDVEKSREFYGKVLGLKEEPPEALALLNGAKKYTFTAGKTTIKFWAGAGENLPNHTGNITDAAGFRYFTFLVKDVDATREILKSRGAKIAVEPVDFGKIARIMMVADPDGNWVEFAAPK
jgi:catechol 2,3-dioxygenase-like lactoylglutathione lyase family enzyme